MNHFEENYILNTKNKSNKHIKLWKRYVDDIFCVWFRTDRQLSQFFAYINKINNNIKFTIEKEINKSLNFLYLQKRDTCRYCNLG